MKVLNDHVTFLLGVLAGMMTLVPYALLPAGEHFIPMTKLLIGSMMGVHVLFPMRCLGVYCERVPYVTGVLASTCLLYVRIEIGDPLNMHSLFVATESYPVVLWLGYMSYALHNALIKKPCTVTVQG